MEMENQPSIIKSLEVPLNWLCFHSLQPRGKKKCVICDLNKYMQTGSGVGSYNLCI